MLDPTKLMLTHYGTDNPEEVRAAMQADRLTGHNVPEADLTRMPFPYYAPDNALPPLPTAEDVEKAQTLEYTWSDRAECASGHVYRVNTVYAVKFSVHKILLQEAENLLFLQDYEVRSPKVYAAFSHQGTDPLGLMTRRFRPRPRSKLPKYYYLVMDYIDGIPLDGGEMWKNLAPEARLKIYDMIGEQLALLRSIPPPNPSYYGRVHYQPYPYHYFMINYRDRCPAGPFDTYEAFLQQALKTLELGCVLNSLWKPEIEPIQEVFYACFLDCFDADKSPGSGEPKLSHMDLKLDNMMLVPSASNPSDKIEDYDLWILDWEYMSWMPAWAEAASSMKRLAAHDNIEKQLLPHWRLSSNGIRPFYYAQANFYLEVALHFSRSL